MTTETTTTTEPTTVIVLADARATSETRENLLNRLDEIIAVFATRLLLSKTRAKALCEEYASIERALEDL
jgi:hypothetical protein